MGIILTQKVKRHNSKERLLILTNPKIKNKIKKDLKKFRDKIQKIMNKTIKKINNKKILKKQ